MKVESGVQVDEVREEAARGHFAGLMIEVIVGVSRFIVDPALLFPDLYRENCGGTVTYPLVSGGEQFADDAATFGGSVRAVIDG